MSSSIIETGGKLIFTSVAESDDGEYECIQGDEYGEGSQKDSVKLKITRRGSVEENEVAPVDISVDITVDIPDEQLTREPYVEPTNAPTTEFDFESTGKT